MTSPCHLVQKRWVSGPNLTPFHHGQVQSMVQVLNLSDGARDPQQLRLSAGSLNGALAQSSLHSVLHAVTRVLLLKHKPKFIILYLKPLHFLAKFICSSVQSL
jgi:hypothetical protein